MKKLTQTKLDNIIKTGSDRKPLDLSYLDLSGINFRGADLIGADLIGADFQGTNSYKAKQKAKQYDIKKIEINIRADKLLSDIEELQKEYDRLVSDAK